MATWQRQSDQVLRVVLFGKVGSGKSSLGNTLLGKSAFTVARPMCSGTKKCQVESTDEVEVMDTPGLYNLSQPNDEILAELKKVRLFVRSSCFVVLLVDKAQTRFTDSNYQAFLDLKELLGDDVCRHTMVVFTAIDNRGRNLAEQRHHLDEERKFVPHLLDKLLNEVENRYIGINNKADPSEKEKQRLGLLHMIKALASGQLDGRQRHMTQEENSAMWDSYEEGALVPEYMPRSVFQTC